MNYRYLQILECVRIGFQYDIKSILRIQLSILLNSFVITRLIFVQDQTHLFPAAAGILFNTGAGWVFPDKFHGHTSINNVTYD